MSPRLKRVAELPLQRQPALFEAMITPHRSLSARGFLVVMCVFSSLNLVLAIFWALRGAWPILLFLTLDVALLTVAFRANFFSARMFERVRIDADSLQVTRQPARGAPEHWIASPYWTRIESREEAVRIAAGDGAVHVGAFLSRPEREDLARALSSAVAAARR